MIKYTFKKIGYATLTLFGVVSVIFMLFNMLPDDPAKMMLGQNQNSEQIAAVQKKYGLDKPIFTQYLLYINDPQENTVLYICLTLVAEVL